MALSMLLAVSAVYWAHASMTTAAQDRLFHSPADLPAQQVGLVLGCSEYIADGRRNLYFIYRMQAAAEAYHSGAVQVLLVSGDNSRVDYDEPTAMRRALVARGVPAEHIVRDYAGFSTLDSVIRAKHIFGANSFCIISQPFHAERALYLSKAHGIAAVGLAAQDVSGRGGLKTQA